MPNRDILSLHWPKVITFCYYEVEKAYLQGAGIRERAASIEETALFSVS